MASVYPGAFDAFSNPLPTDKRTNHAAQHGNVNDAVEAIQAVLGLSPAGGSGTVSARIGVVEGGVLSRVSGPGSSTDNALVRFDGTDGKTVQNSGITVDDSGNVTTDLTVSKASAALIVSASSGYGMADVRSVAGQFSIVYLRTGATSRWSFQKNNTAESGSNAGSNFSLYSYSDAGAFLREDLAVIRSTGKITLGSVGATAGLELGSSGPRVMSGTGSPQGVVTAPVGSEWIRTDGATLGDFTYQKRSGTGNTGWVVKDGDTGQRNLAAETMSNGWAIASSTFRLRRIGSLVALSIAVTKTSATTDVVYTLPTGFLPVSSIYAVSTSATDDYADATVSSGGLVILSRTYMNVATHYLSMTWQTSDAWPTSLPGSAA